jgi:hypothetical protein
MMIRKANKHREEQESDNHKLVARATATIPETDRGDFSLAYSLKQPLMSALFLSKTDEHVLLR